LISTWMAMGQRTHMTYTPIRSRADVEARLLVGSTLENHFFL
jgi:hypothetical protein